MIRLLRFHLALALLLAATFCFAQKGELKFSKDGKFKIVQFTDVHFKYGKPASDVALERINQVLDVERPDLVVFTGDVIYAAPADSGMLKVLEQVSKRELPFVVTFGNHDDEQGLTRSQLYDIIRTVPGNLMPDRGMALSPDYVLTVKSSSDSKKDAALLYCMDTHSYSPLKDVKGYNWLSSKSTGIAGRALLIKNRMADSRCLPLPFSISLCLNITRLFAMRTPLSAELGWKKPVLLR